VHHSFQSINLFDKFDTLAETINDWQNVTRFANINISHGSAATHLRWGGIFIKNFIQNFQLSMSVKELWKSVNI